MRFINEEDLNENTFTQFCEEIARIRKEAKERKSLLSEQNIPQFNSIEEARKYFGSTSFIEWENKMREKYDF